MLSDGPIIVALDGSELAERALPYATTLAGALGKRLVLVTAVYVSEVPDDKTRASEMLESPRAHWLAYLEGVRSKLAYRDVDTLVADGHPEEEIPKAAAELGAALLVASTHGRSGLSRWVHGSTAGHLLHTTRIPLLVIGRAALEREEASPSVQHIMVPLDGSRLSEEALPVAFEVARGASARITLLRAVPWAAQAYPYFTPGMYVPQLDAELLAGARDYLARKRSGAPADLKVEAELLRGPAAECLLTFEEGNAVDLVVMTTHARTGVGRALLGSTADRMLHGRAPVLFVRPGASLPDRAGAADLKESAPA